MTKELDITNHIGYMPQHLAGCRERNRFARRYPKGRRLSGRPLIRMRGITQRKAGHGSNPTRRRLAPQGSQPAKPVAPGKPQRRPSRACVSFPGASPHSPAGVELCLLKILPHRGRGTAGAAGGGGVSPSDRTLTPLRHSLRECHLPFQGRIFKYLPVPGRKRSPIPADGEKRGRLATPPRR